jgi:hypothetical protein
MIGSVRMSTPNFQVGTPRPNFMQIWRGDVAIIEHTPCYVEVVTVYYLTDRQVGDFIDWNIVRGNVRLLKSVHSASEMS